MDKKKLLDNIIGVGKIVGPAVVTQQVYDRMFNHHFYSFKPIFFDNSDFPELESERYIFHSDSKQNLVGYIYKYKLDNYKGLFVFAHGYGGGGHHCYLDLINVLCEYGYVVFAYDATANDESEGHTIKGFTQGLLDADKAISFVKTLPEYQHLPLYLCGHSWGAYSISTALGWHQDVKGIIAMSGFNQATAPFKHNGERYAGDKANDFMIYVDSYERLLFGDVCKTTAIESFKNSNAKICIIHSEDDSTIPIEAGFDLYHKEFKGDKRFEFIRRLIHGHGTIYYTLEGKRYYEKIRQQYNKYVKDNDNPSLELRAEFLKKTIDRKIYNHMVDEKLIKKALDFITK